MPATSPLAERLTAQALAGEPLRSPEAVAERLLAVQGQDPRGARLAVRSRTTGLRAADVDRALSEDRTLLITWLNRGTLHLVRREDYPWLQALTTPPLRTANATRLRQTGRLGEAGGEGGGDDRAGARRGGAADPAAAEGAARSGGCADRGTGARPRPLRRRARRARPCAGRWSATSTPTSSSRDWLGPQPEVDRERALAELARRYLVGHGPADDRDLARWAGLTAAATPAPASRRSPPSSSSAPTASSTSPAAPPAEPLPPPRLLGSFDPLLLGWRSREEVVGPHKMLVTMNGIFRPFALVKGRAVATWRLSGRKLEIEHLGKVTKKAAAELEADGEAVLAYLER